MEKNTKWYKTKDGAMIGGVLKGFSELYNLDVSMVRLIYVLIILFGVGSPLIVYLVLYLILPDKEDVLSQFHDDEYRIKDDEYKI